MIIILSPAKKLQSPKKQPTQPLTAPMFFDTASKIVGQLQDKNPTAIKKFLKESMAISDKLVEENCKRFLAFKHDTKIGTPAVLTFAGDTFQGLQPADWNPQEEKIAADHLFIISGLYGLLRPFDLIQPYRMEMGIALSLDERNGAKNLYEVWQEKITATLAHEKDIIINCASKEYSSVIDRKKLNAPFLTVDFKMLKSDGDGNGNGNGDEKKLQTPGMVIKKYRGQLASLLIKKMATGTAITPDVIKTMSVADYSFSANDSSKDVFCFVK